MAFHNLMKTDYTHNFNAIASYKQTQFGVSDTPVIKLNMKDSLIFCIVFSYKQFLQAQNHINRNNIAKMYTNCNLEKCTVCMHCGETKCDPLCEIQAKVSKYNYEITSIKFRFLLLI